MTRIAQYIKQYGLLKFCLMAADAVCHYINTILRKIFYKWTEDKVGVKEAIFWSKDLDLFLRYSRVLKELRKLTTGQEKQINILEVGAGGEGIARFLKYSGDLKKFDIWLADRNPESLSKIKLAKTFVLSGDRLPFENEKFDAVISIDTLEHIPEDKRGKFLEELKRVSKKVVILHFVIHDPKRQFLGRDGDLRFNEWHLKYFKKELCWTSEHLALVLPTCLEIEEVFDNPVIRGTQNIDVWFNYMTMQTKPLAGFLTGFYYMFKWKDKEGQPPFHGCFVKWTKY
jgi:ubiquinone/menaquinone biosynthesis C-methylase UbiE